MPKRAGYAVLAWAAATATAMGVVWAGLDSVLPTAVESPHVATVAAWPVQEAASTSGATPSAPASPSPAAASSAAPVTHSATKASAAATTAAAAPSTAASSAASSSSDGTSGGTSGGTSSGTEKRYTTPGGTAVLTLYSDHAVLDAATPASGFSAQSWTNSDMLEVEFSPSDAGTVYEVIATWNGTSPQVSTYAVGG